MILFPGIPGKRVRKVCASQGIKPHFLLLFIILSFNLLHSQSVVKLNILQAEKLAVELPARINTIDASPLYLGDSIRITGGMLPYRYAWKSGNQVLSENATMEVIPGNVPYRYSITITDSMDCTATDEVSVVVGIEEKDLLPVKVYPVPATSYLIIEPGEGLVNATVTLYSLSGVKLISQTLNGKTILPLNVKTGFYILEIKHNSLVSLRKIIVSGR